MSVFAGQRSSASFWNTLADSGTYTPVITGSGSDPDLGADGEAVGFWYRQGRLIRGFARFLFSGAGLDPGAGAFRINLPFPADSNFNSLISTLGSGTPVGTGKYRDNSTTANSRNLHIQLTTVADEVHMSASGGNGSITPTFAEGDRISINFRYLADVSSLPDPPQNQRLWRDGGLLPGPQSWRLDRTRRYTPQILDFQGADNPNLGDDSQAVGWWRLAGFFVIGGMRFLWSGTGLDPGTSGSYRMTLPVPSDPTLNPEPLLNTTGAQLAYGWGFVRDDSTPGNSGIVYSQHQSQTPEGFGAYQTLDMSFDNTTGTIGATDFFTWAESDRIAMQFMYPADPEVVIRNFT